MSLLASLRYHLGAGVLGVLLGLQRRRTERRMKKPGFLEDQYSAPPLFCSGRLQELVSRHYLKGRYAAGHRPVAWVTSGGPVEFLTALDFFVVYPENHGAICGIRRTAAELCSFAEDRGWSRDICSYARTDLGSVLSGRTPVGRLPRPDLLLCCTNICQTVLFWYRVLAHHFDVPLILIDTPFIYAEVGDHAVQYVKKQLEKGIHLAERVARRDLQERRLQEVIGHSQDAAGLWLQVLQTARARPAPITAFDEFIHMAPIVEMRGESFTVEYYRAMLAELEQRVARGVGAVRQEKKRLLWDNLPIWFRLRRLSQVLARHGAALVASTYTNAWGELAPLMDSRNPLESSARVYLHPILNRGTGHKLETIRRMAGEYQADGVILHSDRSCKPYSIGQMDQQERLARELNLPALLLQADHNDPRAYADEQAENRLAAFMEVLGI